MHLVGNAVHDVFYLMLNKGKMKLTKNKLELENEILNRFKVENRTRTKVPPWCFSPDDITRFEELHAIMKFPFMNDRNKPRNFFTEGEWLKTHDQVFYASDYGIYICTEFQYRRKAKRVSATPSSLF
jgi:hypothetical protein